MEGEREKEGNGIKRANRHTDQLVKYTCTVAAKIKLKFRFRSVSVQR